MTDQPHQQPRVAGGHSRRPSLYRTVLSLAIAALVAAWLPFSILYISALSKHAAVVATAGSTAQTATGGAAHSVQPVTPVTTRAS